MMKPEGVRITDHADLKREIMRLNQRAAETEQAIRKNFKELYYSLHPVEIIRSAVERIKETPGATGSIVSRIAKMGLGFGASFLIKKLIKEKGTSIASFIFEKMGSVIAKKSSESMLDKLVSLFRKKSKLQNIFE